MKNKKMIIFIISIIGIILCLIMLGKLYDNAERDCLRLHGADYCEKAIKDLKR